MEYALSVNNLCKSFVTKDRNKVVLDNSSFNVKSGSIFGLVGLNGIGKTTTIKIIFDMLDADSGEVSFFGKNHIDPESRRSVCYLPERFRPSQYLTGYDFLEVSLSFFNKKLNKQFAAEIAERVDLDPSVLPLKTGNYSKGMGQKLGLVSCFMSGAQLLVLDEPMSGLDPKSRIILKDTLMEYRKAGNAVFFSSHILEDVNEICDDMAILHGGNIKFHGTPEQLIERYKAQNAERAFLDCISQVS